MKLSKILSLLIQLRVKVPYWDQIFKNSFQVPSQRTYRKSQGDCATMGTELFPVCWSSNPTYWDNSWLPFCTRYLRNQAPFYDQRIGDCLFSPFPRLRYSLSSSFHLPASHSPLRPPPFQTGCQGMEIFAKAAWVSRLKLRECLFPN